MQRRLCRLGGWWRDEDQIRAHAQTLVERFGVRAASIDVAAGSLSGGNLQKVILGRELLLNPKVLLVEQPTRGLDVGAIEAVWQEMRSARDNGGAILLISAELEELFALSDRIAVMYEGRIVQVLANDASAGLRERIGLLMAGGDLAEAEAAHALGH